MDQQHFQQAVDLFKAGDKKGAETILLQLSCEEPENAEIWYGLALCTKVDEERKERLAKCLAVNPDHPKAKIAFEKLTERQKEQQNIQPSDPSSTTAEKTDHEEVNERDETVSKAHISSNWIYGSAILILICLMIWQFIRIDRLEKSMMAANEDLITLASAIDAINGDIRSLSYDISSLSYDLRTVDAIARNADNYAHSHGYSDARLKTDITEIDDPLSKVLQLRGVTYRWKINEYPYMGLNEEIQIGVIAQEVEVVFPSLVNVDQHGFKQVDYERLSVVLIEAIKEQQNEIDLLEDRIRLIERQ